MNFIANINKGSRLFKILLGFAIIIVGILDFLTGYELSFSLFYVIPVYFVTWFLKGSFGIIVSITSAFVWFSADLLSGHTHSNSLFPIWNALIRLSFFVIIALLLSAIKNRMEREKIFASTDYLTGSINSRLFFELLHREIDRLQRYEHPFTLVYIDLDNFKYVNDQFGHHTGDLVLRTVVSYVKKHLRKTDVIARLGGDEFALLLPETTMASAKVVLSKLQSSLLEEMKKNNWLITFSIGVLTCSTKPSTADELMRIADNLMYTVKRNGKNAIKYTTYSG